MPAPCAEEVLDGIALSETDGIVLPPARPVFDRLRQFWAIRSLVASAFGAGLDIAVLVCLVRFCGMDPVIATGIGVLAGGSVNFFLNKRFAFRDRDPRVARQALRYALSTGASFALYEAVYATLTKRLGVDYVVAKLVSDVLVFNVGGLVLNRYVVFPDRTLLAREAGRTVACLALVAAFTGSPAFSPGMAARSFLSAPPGTPGLSIELVAPAPAQPIALARAEYGERPAEPITRLLPAQLPVPRGPALKRKRRPPRA